MKHFRVLVGLMQGEGKAKMLFCSRKKAKEKWPTVRFKISRMKSGSRGELSLKYVFLNIF